MKSFLLKNFFVSERETCGADGKTRVRDATRREAGSSVPELGHAGVQHDGRVQAVRPEHAAAAAAAFQPAPRHAVGPAVDRSRLRHLADGRTRLQPDRRQDRPRLLEPGVAMPAQRQGAAQDGLPESTGNAHQGRAGPLRVPRLVQGRVPAVHDRRRAERHAMPRRSRLPARRARPDAHAVGRKRDRAAVLRAPRQGERFLPPFPL